MFCPKCSQQQISDEARFCSRCGFQLGVVKALLADDGLGSQALGTVALDRSLRKRDATIGALFMFIAALIVAAVTVDLPPSHSARIVFLIIAWLGLSLLINIVPVLRYFFNGDAASRTTSAGLAPGLITQSSHTTRNAALPPAHTAPVTNFTWQQMNTTEVVQPSSITENTTNLLNDK